MKIALYCREIHKDNISFVFSSIKLMQSKGINLIFYTKFLSDNYFEELIKSDCESFSSYEELQIHQPIDFIFSFGGDGSFIDSTKFVRDSNIPVVGINTGRIGFLTSIAKNNFEAQLNALLEQKYILEERNLLHLDIDKAVDFSTFFAINDIVVHSSELMGINGIELWVNDDFVNTYWADGLIIATPTGSTAYSLSCGGPIIHPNANINIITPISSHSLSVRPIIINNDNTLTIKVLSRIGKFFLSLDSNRILVENPVVLKIRKEDFMIRTVKFEGIDYYRIIREKLLWGDDLRNR